MAVPLFHIGTPLASLHRRWARVDLPATDQAARSHLAIPMSPALGREQAGAVVAAVRDAGLG